MRSRGGPTGWSAGGVGLAIAAVAISLVAGPAAGQEHPPDGMLPPGQWTHEQTAYLLDLIERTEEALPAFADATTLEGLGFYNFGVTAPGGYDHWLNPGWVDDGHLLDPAFPEALVFQHTDDGGYELQAAMFMLDSEHNLSNIPEDIAWVPGWHTHEELCVDDEGRFAGLVDGNGECTVGQPADYPPMMHVWIVDNACGHRFGGVGVGGLECDVHHEDPHPPGHEDPPVHEDPHPPGHEDPPPGHDDDHDTAAMAPPAQPVSRQPNLTG
ncbi:MAG: hypothetical protein ACRD2C_18020 [Acidimicrobiales bacterium]